MKRVYWAVAIMTAAVVTISYFFIAGGRVRANDLTGVRLPGARASEAIAKKRLPVPPA